MSHKLKLLLSKNFYCCLVALLIQQAFVAASIYFLTESTRAFTTQNKSVAVVNFLIYLATLVLPFIPGALSLYFLRRWKVDTVEKVILFYEKNFQGQISVWINKKSKEKITSFMSSELPLAVNKYLDSIYGFLSISLNLVFSLFALGLVVDLGIIPFYLLSIFSSFLLLKITQKKIASLELQSQENRVSLNETLRRSWDSLLLKNKGNLEHWQSVMFKTLESFRQSESRAEAKKQITNVSLSFTSLIPTLGYVAWVLFSVIDNTTRVLSTLINVPRLFMLMNNTYAIFSEYNELGASRQNWISLCRELSVSHGATEDVAAKIQAHKIRITSPDNSEISYKDFMELSHSKLKGRYTIRGENGSGKSLTLSKLKENYAEAAYLLPCHNDLFLSVHDSLSSGQKSKSALNWIHENKLVEQGVRVFLLDEWDANLDSGNASLMKQMVNELAQQAIVVEVRHGAE